MAASEFIRAAAMRIDRRALARWLVNDYAPCAMRDDARSETVMRVQSPATLLLESSIDAAVLRARNHALFTLEALTLAGRGEAMARTLLDRGDVVLVTDGSARAHLPVSRARMSLADRVASLFVADFLDEPESYCYVHHCLACGDLALTSRPSHARDCVASDGRSIMTMGVDFFYRRTA